MLERPAGPKSNVRGLKSGGDDGDQRLALQHMLALPAGKGQADSSVTLRQELADKACCIRLGGCVQPSVKELRCCHLSASERQTTLRA